MSTAAAGGLRPGRPDQHYEPPAGGQAIPGARAVVRAREVLIVGHGNPPAFGLFVYDPTLALNNLIASITARAGTDPAGNAVLPGIVNYNFGGGASTAAQLNAGALELFTSAGLAGPWTAQGEIFVNTSGLTIEAPLGSITLTCITAGQPIALQNPTSITSGVTGSHVLGITQQTAAPAATIAQLQAAGAADKCFAFIVAGDTQPRLRIDTQASGIALHFGGGTTLDFVLQELSATCLGLTGGADFAVDTVGNGLQVKEGASAKQGSFTLTAGTHTVANTTVTANSRIFLTAQDNNSTGALRVSGRTAGTSFTVTSSNAADSGLVAYEIFEPAP